MTGGTNTLLQSVTKCNSDNRRNSQAVIVLSGVAKDDLTLSMLLPFTLQGTRRNVRRISTKRISPSRVHGGIPNSHRYRLYFRRPRKPSSAGVDFSSGRCLLDCGPKRHGRELLRSRPHVSTSSRTLASRVLRRTIHSSYFLHCVLCRFRFHATLQSVTKCGAGFSKDLYVNVVLIVVNFRGDAFDPLCFHPPGEQDSVCLCNNEMRFDVPCQDAGEGFGFQEESEVEALPNCESTSYVYCCRFGVPYDCSQGITAAGLFPQSSSVVMWRHLTSERTT